MKYCDLFSNKSFCLAALLLWGQVSFAESLGLADLLRLAEGKSPALANLRRDLDMAVLRKEVALRNLLPRLSLHGEYGYEHRWREEGTLVSPQRTSPWTSDFSLVLSQKLGESGASFLRVTQSQAELERDSQAQTEERNLFALNLSEAFFEHLSSLAEVELEEKRLDLIKKQYESLAKLYRQGLRSKMDFLRIKAELARAEFSFAKAQEKIPKTRSQLYSQLGFADDSWDFSAQTLLGDQVSGSKSLGQIEENPRYRLAQLEAKVEEARLSLARRALWPQLGLQARLGYQTSDFYRTDLPYSQRRYWGAALTFDYNLIDFGTQSREKLLALRQFEKAESKVQGTREELTQEAAQWQRDFNLAQREAASLRELVGLEEESAQFLLKEYRAGKVAYLEMITGLEGLSSARLRLVQVQKTLKYLESKAHYFKGDLFAWLISKN